MRSRRRSNGIVSGFGFGLNGYVKVKLYHLNDNVDVGASGQQLQDYDGERFVRALAMAGPRASPAGS